MGEKLGQHFLKSKKTEEQIAAAMLLEPGEVVIEVGAGHGELTEELLTLNINLRIVAVEKDPRLVSFLRNRFRENKNVEINEGDILKVLKPLSDQLKTQNYKLVGNIPYYLTGYLLRILGELENKPELAVLMTQKEVAERIAARPPKMNRLAASVQFWAEVEILEAVPRSLFNPPPEVDSSVIRLKTRVELPGIESKTYYGAVAGLFQQPRKTILNNLTQGLSREEREKAIEKLEKLGLDPKLRPQNLDLGQIIKIGEIFFS